MAALKLVVLALACYCVSALPPTQKTTIFGDERLQGEIFENLNDAAVFNEGAEAYRLPTTTKPNHYTVLWAVDFTSNPQAFSGTVDIQLEATQAGVSEIVIQSEDLTIGTLVLSQGTTQVPVTLVAEPERQFLKIQLNTGTLAYSLTNPVEYTLTINFEAPMRDDMYGIYRSWFKNEPNETASWMATTQFQATSARRAFPCYDEPSFKATFDITIRRPNSYRSWSCTRINSTVVSSEPNYSDDIYFRTPIMSTYLLAIIVAEYESLPVTNDDGELIYEVIARPNAIATYQGQYALNVGQALLAEMSNHTDLDFYSVSPGLKMTQASIPDFSAGAMENWGLLTYREAYLMYDEVHTNGYFKQLIAYILSHEIAHMWFGNLVTCDWWDVLWLNEGFARYYQYFLTDWVEPHLGLGTRFITEQVHTALLTDSSNNPHPLSYNPGVGSPASVSAMFSTLSYNKGAAIIRMTEHLLGSDVHRAGLRNYLVDYRFQTAHPINLFESLEAAGIAAGALTAYGPDFSLVDYYRSWTEQRGHPVLTVHVNHQTGDMTIYQRRFNINTGYSNVNTNWIIPITFSSASDPYFDDTKPTHIISKAVTVINRGSIGDEWVIFNKQQTGYYRVNYDDYTWDLITAALRGPQRTQIDDYNRAQIVNDVFQFARSGLMSYTKAFNILSFLEFETSYAPWVAAMTGFSWLRQRLTGTQFLNPLEDLIASWSTVVMSNLTYTESPEDDFMRSYLRYQLAPVACQLNRDGCRAAAVDLFTRLRQGEEVPADSRNWVYCNALREGTTEDFEFLRNRFINHNVYTEKILLLQVLGCTPHATSLHQFLSDIVSPNEIVRPQDYTTAFNSAVTGNEENTQIVFQWVQNNLQAVSNAFNSVATPLSYISARLRNETEIVAFETWANQNAAVLGDAYNAVISGAQSARASIQWTATVTEDIDDYLDNGFQEISLTTPGTPPPTQPPVLEERPALVEPETPELPSSAVTSFLSMTVLGLAAMFKIFL